MRTAILCLFALAPLYAQEQAPATATTPSAEVSIQSVKGDVDMESAAGKAWTAAAKGTKVPIGVKVCTGSGAEVVIGFGTSGIAIIGENSMLRVDQCAVQGSSVVIRLFVDPGVATASVKRQAMFSTDFQVSTPRLTCSVRGSAMHVIANGDEVKDTALCVEDETVVRRLRLWHEHLEQDQRIDSDRTPHRDLSARERQGFVSPFAADPNGEEILQGDGRLTADQIAELAGSLDVLYADLARDGSNPQRLVDSRLCRADTIAQDESLLNSRNFDLIVDFLRSGDPSLLPIAQSEVDFLHSAGSSDPTLIRVDEALHRLEHCSPYGDQLQDPTRP